MIDVNGHVINLEHFPDGTLHLREEIPATISARITWRYKNNEELLALYFITRHLQEQGVERICLVMPYIPNARQDRVKSFGDVFTLKYFAEIINSLHFNSVVVHDPHSYVSEALINNLTVVPGSTWAQKAIEDIGDNNLTLFFPDEGAMKRYSSSFDKQYTFGMKNRDWGTGKIKGLDVAGDTNLIKDHNILIIDDICSRGGTFYHSALKLKELGAKDIYLYVTHLEDSVNEGILRDYYFEADKLQVSIDALVNADKEKDSSAVKEYTGCNTVEEAYELLNKLKEEAALNTNLIKKIYTTDSIFNKDGLFNAMHAKVAVIR